MAWFNFGMSRRASLGSWLVTVGLCFGLISHPTADCSPLPAAIKRCAFGRCRRVPVGSLAVTWAARDGFYSRPMDLPWHHWMLAERSGSGSWERGALAP